MSQQFILYPAFALVLWTFAMVIVMVSRAMHAVRVEGLDPEYFRYGNGFDAPHAMRSAYLLYGNLFEMPVLFYLAMVVGFITNAASPLLLLFAWGYVASRAVHSLLLLKNSNIERRRDSFLASTVILMAIWAMLLWRLL